MLKYKYENDKNVELLIFQLIFLPYLFNFVNMLKFFNLLNI